MLLQVLKMMAQKGKARAEDMTEEMTVVVVVIEEAEMIAVVAADGDTISRSFAVVKQNGWQGTVGNVAFSNSVIYWFHNRIVSKFLQLYKGCAGISISDSKTRVAGPVIKTPASSLPDH